MDMSEQDLPSAITISVLVLNFLLDIHQVLCTDISLQILTQLLSGSLKVFLVILKYGRLVVLSQVICKDISVHQRTTTLAQDVQTLLEELDLDPGHVVLLHLLHLVLHHRVQLVLELQGLKMVHVSVAIKQVSG